MMPHVYKVFPYEPDGDPAKFLTVLSSEGWEYVGGMHSPITRHEPMDPTRPTGHQELKTRFDIVSLPGSSRWVGGQLSPLRQLGQHQLRR